MIPCPRCHFPQPFGERKAEVEPGIFEIYIQCKKCRWKEVVIRGDSSKIHEEREITKLKVRAKRDPSLYPVLQRKLKRKNE